MQQFTQQGMYQTNPFPAAAAGPSQTGGFPQQQPRRRFCMNCGSPMHPNGSFCMRCGVPFGIFKPSQAQAMQNPQPSVMQSVPIAAPTQDAPAPQSGGSSMPVIVGIIAIFGALIILVCVLLMNGAFDKEEGEVAGEAPIEQQSVQEEEAPVAYTTYTTDDLVTRDYSYPVFQFEFPSTWSIIKESSNAFQEKVEMQRSGSNAIAYKLLDPDQPVNLDSGISNIEKVSDCDLRARLADESGDGYHYEQYVVAKMDVASANDTTKSVYAVIPEDGVSDRSKMNLIGTAPAFDLGCWVSFSFEAKEDMDQGILDEAIEVLSSLQMLGIEDMEASGYGYYDSSDPGYCSSGQGYYSPYSDGSYLIPESGTRLLTDRDLDGYDAYYLYFARNEIFARHGRKFQNDDLQEYFNLMPWYTPLIEPEDFDDSYLSDIEKANYEKILEYERAMDSPYI